MKCFKKLHALFFIVLIFSGCVTNPLTGRRTMALISNAELFPMAFAQYEEFLRENTVVTGTPEALMIERVGFRIVEAAEKWLAREGQLHHLNGYEWEFRLIQDNSINAWVMPGGKIVFYTGILPVTQTEAGVAVVMGHEIAHALLNHGQQRMSAGILQQLGALAVFALTSGNTEQFQSLVMTAYGVGSTMFGTLPFSRENELEADRFGLILMAIAGYNPEEGAAFWQRMSSAGGGSVPQFLSTHPSDASRIRNLYNIVPEAKRMAAGFGVHF
jgi:predicted Zn-dependent protease